MNNPSESLQELAYKTILNKLLRLEYAPGQKISQKNIEDDLQMGRTPVREALLHLKKDGLIYSVPQSGTFVQKINLADSINALYIREKLECSVIMEAAKIQKKSAFQLAHESLEKQSQLSSKISFNDFFETDDDFHKTFYLATAHEAIWDWIQTVNFQLNRLRELRLKMEIIPWEGILEQHQDILTAVENHDVEKANEVTAYHIHLMLDQKDLVVNKYKEYFI